MIDGDDVTCRGDWVGGLGDGKIGGLIVDEEVGFLEECAAESILPWGRGAANREIVCSVWINGLRGLEVECCVGKCNVGDLAERRTQGKGDLRI